MKVSVIRELGLEPFENYVINDEEDETVHYLANFEKINNKTTDALEGV
jgi:hypothetical protein